MAITTYKTDIPESFSNSELQIFINLLTKQDKVRNPSIEKLYRCKYLSVCMVGDEIVSIGATKPKTNSDFDPAKADLPHLSVNFRWEIGYCYTDPDHIGKGYSSSIVEKLIGKLPEINLMASTELRKDNSMLRILERNGFKQFGNVWKSTIHNGDLGLFLKFPVSE
ncbi:hypothetical protein [Flavobacterium sp. GSB-24]|uniref:GNAT family N-acetyltransferase n=1 Tax=Flavobacterium sp. GSB-24 TaxID=2994319 RepID=UPI002491A898|nr:hypothetical protein [Flavobacterium sp. GSB-24]BDU25127.1 hypothetical protein FLGSB24_18710 [Flavobacterium sp. GSB-24]